MVGALDSVSRGPGSSTGRVIVLCSWARHFTLTVPLSTQEYKWVPAMSWKPEEMLGVTCDALSRRSDNTPSRVMLRKPG